MSAYPIAAALPKTAYALRPLRIFANGNGVHYTGTTFPHNPYQGCELTLRRCEAFGYLVPASNEPLPDLCIDVLDKEGDILDTIGVTRDGFEYLRRTLRFKREN